MRFRRAGTALLLALLGGTPVAPATAGEPAWVRVDGDFVVGSAAARAVRTTGAERSSAALGFAVYDGHESYGSFTIRLRESQGVETLRPYVAQAAREIVAATGMSLSVAAGTVTADAPAPGEILLEVSTTSPCEGSWSGCGGPRTSATVAGRSYWTSGQAWIHPNVLGFTDHSRQHVVSHELGHTVGLRHFDDRYAGEAQVMHSTNFEARSYRGGDRNGLAWLRPDPPVNDGIAAATAIGPETSSVAGSNGWATAEPGEPYHAGSAPRRSVWFRWTASRPGMADFDTLGSAFDTRLAVYAGTAYGALEPVAENDDYQGRDRARVRFQAEPGTTYSIAVDSHQGSVGSVRLQLTFDGPVTNDRFDDAMPVPAHGGLVTGSNTGTGEEYGEPPHSTQVAARASAWFRWTAPRSGPVEISTRGSSFDTVLAVYTGPAVGSLTRVAGNDDDSGAKWSRVRFSATAGTAYSVAVAGYNGATGSIALFVDSGIDRYTPVAARRILDSRSTGPWRAGETRRVDVAGLGGIPATGVSAVLLNVTVTRPTSGGYVTVWPSGLPRPHASNLNFRAGQTVASAVRAKLGPDGRIGIFNSAGATHVVVDVVGYTRPYGALGFDPAPTPVRLLDSRRGIGTAASPWEPDRVRAVQVAGRAGVPADAAAVVLNLTAVAPTSTGYVKATAGGAAIPHVSNLNFDAGRTVANLAVVQVGPGGMILLYNSAGRTHLVADVLGWYRPSGRYVGTTATPARIVDSRTGTGVPARPWRGGETRSAIVAGAGGVPPSGAVAAVLTVTAVSPSTGGWLSAWPNGWPRPNASTVNFGRGENVANLTVSRLGAGGWLAVHNATGWTHVTADVAGWYYDPPPG